MNINLSKYEAIKILTEILTTRIGETVTVTIEDDTVMPTEFIAKINEFTEKVYQMATSTQDVMGKISAIKYYRSVTGEGLVESKNMVEYIMEGKPEWDVISKIVLVKPYKI